MLSTVGQSVRFPSAAIIGAVAMKLDSCSLPHTYGVQRSDLNYWLAFRLVLLPRQIASEESLSSPSSSAVNLIKQIEKPVTIWVFGKVGHTPTRIVIRPMVYEWVERGAARRAAAAHTPEVT